MRECAETMEQHGRKLYYQNQGKEEHKDETNRLQLQILLGNVHLYRERCDSISTKLYSDMK